MPNSINKTSFGLGRMGAILFSLLLVPPAAMITFPPGAEAAPPGKCEPWPQCKNDSGGGGGELPPFELQFQPQTGRSGLLTMHVAYTAPDYSDRHCPGHPELDNTVWTVPMALEKVGDLWLHTSTGPDLVVVDPETQEQRFIVGQIDLFNSVPANAVQFQRSDPQSSTVTLDGCFGATDAHNGKLTYSIRKVGEQKNAECQVQLSWDFDFYVDSNGAEEYLNVTSGWMSTDRDPGRGPNANCSADKHLIDTVEGDFQLSRIQTVNGEPYVVEQDFRNMAMWVTILKN